MKRILTLTAIALGLSSGVALADRHYGGGRAEIRDHRGDNVRYRQDNRRWNRGYRNNARVVQANRVRPTFRNNRFYFGDNTYRAYHRPVINVRYRDYSRRPTMIIENYDPVPGYFWSQGNWEWNGYEWTWIPGHYEVDTNHDHQVVNGNQYNQYDNSPYNNPTYNNSTYDNTYDSTYDYDDDYDNSYRQPYTPAPVYNNGVTIQGRINF